MGSFISLTIFHPITMAGLLIFNCFIISLFIMWTRVTWLFYLLVLIFLGGVMVIIIYITSLAANEKIFWTSKFSWLNLTPLVFISVFVIDERTKKIIRRNFSFVGDLFGLSFIIFLLGCFIILLLTIISVIKIIKLEEGPLIKRLWESNLKKNICLSSIKYLLVNLKPT